ncbi:MAG: helix-turn-helix transcriptional regulator [Verrucomicrobiae bacterium]
MPSQKPKSCVHRAKLGGNIAALRGQRNLTQEQLAEKTGVSARYIQSLEAGEYFPSLPKLVKLKLALRCGWPEIFDGCEKV